MYNMRYQMGMGALGWIAVLALVGFISLLGLKTIPVYINSFTISSILSDMEQEIGMGSKSPSEIVGTFFKRTSVNNIRDIDRDSVYIESERGFMILGVEYEVRRTFIGNMDLVLSFEKRAEIPKN